MRHGHPADALSRYTTRQVALYHREALRAEARAQADRIEAAWLGTAAAWGGGKSIEDYVRKLRGSR